MNTNTTTNNNVSAALQAAYENALAEEVAQAQGINFSFPWLDEKVMDLAKQEQNLYSQKEEAFRLHKIAANEVADAKARMHDSKKAIVKLEAFFSAKEEPIISAFLSTDKGREAKRAAALTETLHLFEQAMHAQIMLKLYAEFPEEHEHLQAEKMNLEIATDDFQKFQAMATQTFETAFALKSKCEEIKGILKGNK